MRISDWSSDVCSSDLRPAHEHRIGHPLVAEAGDTVLGPQEILVDVAGQRGVGRKPGRRDPLPSRFAGPGVPVRIVRVAPVQVDPIALDRTPRSEKRTSELQSLMRNTYPVFCLT